MHDRHRRRGELTTTMLASLLAAGCHTGLHGTDPGIGTGAADASPAGATGSDGGDSGPGDDDSGERERCEGPCSAASPMQLMRRNQVIGALQAAAELVSAIGCADEACVETELRRVLPILFKQDPLEGALRALAAEGGLYTSEGVASAGREMLADPRARLLRGVPRNARFGDHGRDLEGSAIADDDPGLRGVAADMQAVDALPKPAHRWLPPSIAVALATRRDPLLDAVLGERVDLCPEAWRVMPYGST